MGGDQVIPKLAPGLNDHQGEGKVIAEWRKELILHRYAQTLTPARGSRDLVLKIQDAGLQLVIASSATAAELELLLKIAQIEGLIEQATTSTNNSA